VHKKCLAYNRSLQCRFTQKELCTDCGSGFSWVS